MPLLLQAPWATGQLPMPPTGTGYLLSVKQTKSSHQLPANGENGVAGIGTSHKVLIAPFGTGYRANC